MALTDHDTAEGWPEAADDGGRGRHHPGPRHGDQHRACGPAGVHLLGYLPDPTYPPLAAALDKILDGRNSRVPAICAKLQRPRLRHHGRGRTPPRGRRSGHRSTARGRRDDRRRHRGDPGRGLRALPQPRAARLRQPLRRTPRRGDRAGDGLRWRRRDRPPVGPRPVRCAHRGHAWPACATRAWSASRSTTRTTRPRRARRCGRSRATSTWSSRARATTTAPARSTTSWAATPRHPRSSSACSTLAAQAAAASGRPAPGVLA